MGNLQDQNYKANAALYNAYYAVLESAKANNESFELQLSTLQLLHNYKNDAKAKISAHKESEGDNYAKA